MSGLRGRRQWIIYRLSPSVTRPGKTDKIPCDPRSGYDCNAHDPGVWVSHDEAVAAANRFGRGYGRAFVITKADSFFCLDIDGCLEASGQWSALSVRLCQAFPGARVEVSQSGRGLHIWGSYAGEMPAHKSRGPAGSGLELYHELRFIALGTNEVGDETTDCTAALGPVIREFFPPGESGAGGPADWTEGPVEGARPIADDADLIRRACAVRQSFRGALAGKATFEELWRGDEDALSRSYPDGGGQGRPYDASSADAALAQHLAFWTGNDCERMQRLMQQSGLVREKWDREDYLPRTILSACSRQTAWYVEPEAAPPSIAGAAGGLEVPALPSPFVDARDGTATTRPLTELGNALRMMDAHGANLRYVPEADGWIVWQGGAWAWDRHGAAVRSLAATLPARIYSEGAGNLYEGDKYAKWARQSQQSGTIKAAVSLLSDMPAIRVPLTLLDADPMVVGINGARHVVDLRFGTVRAAEQTDYVTKSLAVAEAGRADACPRWRLFLAEVFNHDRQMIDWYWRFLGYLLTGSVKEQCFVFQYGHGSNGKGTLVELLKFIMGDYGRAISVETLTDSRRNAGQASPDLASLIGARLAITSETENDNSLAETLVKTITGSDTISVRQLYAPPVDFLPQFKLMISGNHKPIIRGTDNGIWRRVRLVPFTREFTRSEMDADLPVKLRSEAPHIVAWMVQGCLEWQRRGLADVPAVVEAATSEYRTEMDLVGRFIEEQCTTGPQCEADGRVLYTGYKMWALENGLRAQTSASFGRRLVERGITQRKSHGARVWCGVALRMGGTPS